MYLEKSQIMAKIKAKQAKPIKTPKAEKYKEPSLGDLIEDGEDVIGLSYYYIDLQYPKVCLGYIVNHGNGIVFILDYRQNCLVAVDIKYVSKKSQELQDLIDSGDLYK
jgi:hypothetical protein